MGLKLFLLQHHLRVGSWQDGLVDTNVCGMPTELDALFQCQPAPWARAKAPQSPNPNYQQHRLSPAKTRHLEYSWPRTLQDAQDALSDVKGAAASFENSQRPLMVKIGGNFGAFGRHHLFVFWWWLGGRTSTEAIVKYCKRNPQVTNPGCPGLIHLLLECSFP